jgi:hypothetical protein
MVIKTANMSTYIKDFTIRPAEGPFMQSSDVLGKIANNQECCVITSDRKQVFAVHYGGYFTRLASNARILNVTEATPIAPESQWPTGSDWSTTDWEEHGIYPPRPVQPAVLIVELSDGRTFEVVAPFTDETPNGKQEQKDYQDDLDLFESNSRHLYRYATLPNKPTDKKITVSAIYWAWQEKPETK